MRFAAFLLAAFAAARGAEWQAGYDLHASDAGMAHGIAGEAAWEYLETGLIVGYGAKPIHKRLTTTNPLRPGTVRSTAKVPATALRIDAPLRLKYGKWPHLVAQLGYERVLEVEGAQETGTDGFAKANEITLYYGAGYALWIRGFGIRLEMCARSVLTDPDKSAYYRDPGEGTVSASEFDSERFGSAIRWQAGLRYRFGGP